MNLPELNITEDDWLDIQNISLGAFKPLEGFMLEADYRAVIQEMRLSSGIPWTIPVTLAVPDSFSAEIRRHEKVALVRSKTATKVAELTVESIFHADYSTDIERVFKTTSLSHPGVKKETGKSSLRVGGKLSKVVSESPRDNPFFITPTQSRETFVKRGWKKVVGFQTRNPIHRAHEHLQRIGLEITDGLFIQPLVGWKKEGDFTADAVISAYTVMAEQFFPRHRIVLGTLNTQMRYAGPREAVFHSIIRKNYGCTHFIVGRDHAGVGNFYGKYESQELCRRFDGELGIEILALGGPFHCRKCLGIATEHSCGHDADARSEISGTLIRKLLSEGKRPPEEFMRAEIADALIHLKTENRLFY